MQKTASCTAGTAQFGRRPSVEAPNGRGRDGRGTEVPADTKKRPRHEAGAVAGRRSVRSVGAGRKERPDGVAGDARVRDVRVGLAEPDVLAVRLRLGRRVALAGDLVVEARERA